MAKIPASTIVQEFNVMLAEHWPYVWGAARKGCVDCSGAFVYVYNKYGASIYHGSNRIARRYVHQLIPYAEAKAKGLIVPGVAAFKARTPGMGNYALPSSYTKGGAYYNGDLNDYYHIGLVDFSGQNVLNAQGSKTGFVLSPISQNWSHVALLTNVDYGAAPAPEEDDPMEGKATVTGGALFLREAPTKDARTIARMENGTEVEILEDHGDWVKARPLGKTGFCMKKFLKEDA